MYDVVLFDLDGTLLDSADCGVTATQRAFLHFGYRMPERAEVVHWMGIPIEQSFPAMAQQPVAERELAELLAHFRSIYRELSDEKIRLFEGVGALLARLHCDGVEMGIVTSKHSHVAHRNMTSTGICGLFKTIVGPDMVSRCKPHADTALKAAEIMRVSGDASVVVIGDSRYDIEMGKAANFETCAVTWGAHSEPELVQSKPTHLVNTIEQLDALLVR
jgi:phosphoglycolate phosphatase